MTPVELRKIVRETILKIGQPFNTSDLYYRMRKDYGILNRILINEVLDELCESGAVDYSEIDDGVWAFNVIMK